MQQKHSDLGFISIAANKPIRLFSICLLTATLAGCGEMFGVGGASIEGTGNGQPPAPGMGHAGNVEDRGKYTLELSGAVADVCQKVIREIHFKDPIHHDNVRENKSYKLNINKEKSDVELELSFFNTSDREVLLNYPDCDVPLLLSDANTQKILFPKYHCNVMKSARLMPNELRLFKLSYRLDLDTALTGLWQLDPKLNLTIPTVAQEQCGDLKLSMKIAQD